MALDLIVADWRVAGAAAADFPLVEETDLDLLDPPPVPEVDWHDAYAAELAAHPAIAADLLPRPEGSPGDGIERVLERANLRPAERRVLRAWLYTPDLDQVAADLGEKPLMVRSLFKHGLNRLEWLARNESSHTRRGDDRSEAAIAARALTEKIRNSSRPRPALLVQAYESKAWKPLGYPSWYAYANAEFHIDERQTSRWLEQARVAAAAALEQTAS